MTRSCASRINLCRTAESSASWSSSACRGCASRGTSLPWIEHSSGAPEPQGNDEQGLPFAGTARQLPGRRLGEFRWSSQHLVDGGVRGNHAGAAAGGAAVSGSDPVARSADGGVAGLSAVLGGDRAGRQLGGRSARDRRVIRGRSTVVPSRWRREPLRRPGGVGPLLVLRGGGGHRHLGRAEDRRAGDRSSAPAVDVDDLS